MALNEMEFLGNNRYFKYRFANKTGIMYGTDSFWLSFKSKRTQFLIMADYLKRSLNIWVYSFQGTHAFDLYTFKPTDRILESFHIFTFDTPSSFFNGRLEYFTPSGPYGTTTSIILSAAPKRVTSTSLSFLNMDTPVVILIASTLVVLSILPIAHSIVTNKYKSMPIKKVVKKMARETLENVWENASLLCAEPIPSILRHITCRLLASSWMIGVTFILFYLGCFLRTEFTIESYNYIDTLSDLIKSGISPLMLPKTYEHLEALAAHDTAVKKWLSAFDKTKVYEEIGDNLEDFEPVRCGKKSMILTVEMLLSMVPYLRMSRDLGDFKDKLKHFVRVIKSKGGLYFSQEDVAFDYVHTIFNTSWVRSSPQLHESLQLSMAPFFETKVFKYLDFELDYRIEQLKWEKPLESVTDLDLRSVCVPFYFLLMLLSGTVGVAITEIIFYYLT